MFTTKLKICGMKVPANITEAVALQPDYLGFIFYPASKRFIEDLDPAIVKTIPAGIQTTGVFVNEELDKVKAAVKLYQLKAVQLHGQEGPEYCKQLQEETVVIKAFGINADFDFSTLTPYEKVIDYFLFDTQTPEHGGSGKTFSWQLLERYTLQKPYFLSGGIGLESAAALKEIKDKRLYAIDVNSRFEISAGLKDITQLIEFKKLLGYPRAAD
jgi:phosphoribosylanthranilate isomerase